MSENLITICKDSKQSFDLTSDEDQNYLYNLVEKLLGFDNEEVLNLGNQDESPLSFKIAAKIVDSKNYIKSCKNKKKIAVVFAMWGEQNRLLAKSLDNPNGEDLLNVKIQQLNYLFNDSTIEWKLYAVDDGCPHKSGDIAEEIRLKSEFKDNVEVLWLENHLPSEIMPLKNLKSADDSRKGGAILLGSDKAVKDGMDLIVYTDADNSVHLSQLGLLLRPHIEDNYKVVLGNRKGEGSVLVKQESRWGIGIKALRHMQRMVGHSIFNNGIKDSQAAFKLYHKDILRDILKNPSVFDFSFDSDWISAVIARNENFAIIPFAFIDSFAESASIVQGPMTTWETLLKGLVKAVRARGIPHNEEMANLIMEKIENHHVLDILIKHLPKELEDAEDKDLGNPDIMSVKAMGEWIDKMKNEFGDN